MERQENVPLRPGITFRDLDVFVWGHSHAPFLSLVHREGLPTGIAANCGCWLRQLRPVPAHFRAPTVFVPRFVMSHVRLVKDGPDLRAELHEHPRQAPFKPRWVERLAILGRVGPPVDALGPRVTATARISGERPARN